MEMLLIVAALVCQPGERLIDLSRELPRGLQFMDFVVSLEPFYARLYIYQLGFPDSFQQCCSNKPTSVLRVPIGTGRFCVRQSQPQMKWRLRGLIPRQLQRRRPLSFSTTGLTRSNLECAAGCAISSRR